MESDERDYFFTLGQQAVDPSRVGQVAFGAFAGRVGGMHAAAGRLGVGERGVGGRRFRSLLQHDEQVGEVDAAQEQPDGGHDHIGDERLDDRAEGGADHDTNRHVHDIAAHGKFLEFLEHSVPFHPVRYPGATASRPGNDRLPFLR